MDNLINYEVISLKNHPVYNEKWIQQQIANNPSIIGIGDLILKDKERGQPRAGRLDLLLQDSDSDRRYEVEIQLGKTDESHIIRTIEYWDIERKRYPQYDHCAVIVAEDITSRFFNVIGLFNGHIPIIAIQVKALKIGEDIALVFTTILDELVLGLDEDDATIEVTDRKYWENKSNTKILKLVDKLHERINDFAPNIQLKYNKFYIGLARNGQACNFVSFKAKKGFVRLELKLQQSNEIQDLLDSAELDVMEYANRWGIYRIRLTLKDVEKNSDLISKLMKMAYDNYNF